jgi:DNA repair protein SbcD/Mre11
MGSARAESGFCFVHAADLHLGARRWLGSTPRDLGLRERIAHADRLALSHLIELCLQEDARLLICAGDVFDRWCRDHRVAMFFVSELLRLEAAKCRVVLLLGNHDQHSRLLNPLLLPRFARVIGRRGPETLTLAELGVALHGWSAPEPVPMIPVFQPQNDVGRDVAAMYPAPIQGLLNIGILHTSAEGRRGHADYAPCSRKTLRGLGYDYWALGHVHAREVIAMAPWIVFPGNLQGRGPRESGAKGASLVRVSAGAICSVAHHALHAVRFETVVADLSCATQWLQIVARVSDALAAFVVEHAAESVVVRLVLRGIAGAACLLELPSWERSRRLDRLARQLSTATVWIDEIWIDAGNSLGIWPVARAA